MGKFRALFRHRFGPVAVLLLLVIFLSLITRIVLMSISWQQLDLTVLHFLGIYLIGLLYDIVVGLFFAVPVAIFCWLMKDSWYRQRWSRILLYALFGLITIILVVNAVAEVVFWNEFSVRYNFIAVDYLVYTTEVLGNIRESYNMPLILSAVLIVSVLLFLSYRRFLKDSAQSVLRFGKRTIWFLGIMLVTAAGYFLMNNRLHNISDNNYVNELGGNGVFEFGSAFWHNEINYKQFYIEGDSLANLRIVRNMLQQPNARFTTDPMRIDREIIPDSPAHPWNIVLISVESLSGSFMAHFGNKENITPFLDSLIPHTLFFENFFASGTRTVRGLEALSLAIPPTPGQSIIRRPGNEDMFTMGNVLKGKGYDVRFVYGGNSFFDNMGYFFGHNGYTVTDQRDIPEERIHHTTAWGVADEDAFDIMLDKCDESYARKKLFFNHLMTVSNHRPYTYPEGRIDIPGNAHYLTGAVKYTDYSINRFLLQASKKPWFESTIFIIVADHCSHSAGKTDLPVNNYHIPCLVYAPGLVKPRIEEGMTSQVDLVPTILGMMNVGYTSKFLGIDIFHADTANRRVFVSTYQDMGYLRHDTLAILSPVKKISYFKVDLLTGNAKPIPPVPYLRAEAVAWYQTASYLFKSGKYRYTE